MKLLDGAKSVVDFLRHRLNHFDRNIGNAFAALEPLKKQDFLLNLDYVFGLKLSPITIIRVDETAMDAGLLYFDDTAEQYKALSNPASQSLMKFFLANVKTNLVPILSRVCQSEHDSNCFFLLFLFVGVCFRARL